MNQRQTPLSRRTVATGLAWSVPAVAAVSVAPFAAASPPACPDVTTQGVVKYPGGSAGHGLNQAYGMQITITNDTGATIRIAAGSVNVVFDKKSFPGTVVLFDKDPCQGGVRLSPNDPRLELDPGEEVTVYFVANNTGNSANDGGCIEATLDVTLVSGTPNSAGGLCSDASFQKCFTDTPPTAAC